MTLYFLVKYLHLLGAIIILGTGTGIGIVLGWRMNQKLSAYKKILVLVASGLIARFVTDDLCARSHGFPPALVKTGPAIVLMLVALLTLDNR